MGIVNATPDSFSDAGDHPTLEARVAHGAALLEAGADLLDVGGESARGDRPAVDGRGGDRARRAADRAADRRARRARVGRHLQAGGGRGGDRRRAPCSSTTSPGCATRRWPTSARAPAPGSCSCTRAWRRRARCSIPAATTTWWPTSPASCASGWPLAIAHGVDARAARCSTRAPTSPRRRRRRSRCCGALGELHALGRPVLLAVSNKDFVGALTGRGPRERLAGTLAAVAHGVDAGAHVLRVHDVAAAADFLRVRAVLRGDVELAPEEGLTPDRYPAAERKGLPAAAHNAAGCQPTTELPREDAHVRRP